MAIPTITSISPTYGPIAGGTSVTISGANFTGTTSVMFGSTAAASFSVSDDNTIDCTTAPGSAGVVSLVVTNADGPSTDSISYTYVGVPTVSAISPTYGPLAGSTSVTISGTNFTGATDVKFGSSSASSVSVNSDGTSISCTTPSASSAGSASVQVTNAQGTSAESMSYTYVGVPTVSAISPISGPLSGGVSVTITGTNFTGATGVKFGSSSATSVSVSSDGTSISCTTPSASSAGSASVQVTNAQGTNTSGPSYTYQGAPTVAGISPAVGPLGGGATVTISGANFIGATGVSIGGATATIVSVSSDGTSISCTTTTHSAGSASVVVTTPSGTNSTSPTYTYQAAPTVTAIAATGGISTTSGSANGGTSLTITGTNFTGATGVSIGGNAATGISVVSSTSISCTTPAGSPGPASVAVTTPSGTSAANSLYTYVLTPPTVTDISPPAGSSAGGTSVTITGTNLRGATSVTIRGVAATSVTVVSDTSIVCTTPAGSAGSASVAVTTPSGTASNSLFTYVQPPPTINAGGVSPSTGSTLGGTLLTITGTYFTGAGGVTIGGVPATNVTVISSTTLTCVTPPGSVGTESVVVTTAGGTNADNSLFSYELKAPSVTDISPASGTSAGGTMVTLTGQSFTGATSVSIGGMAATRLIVVDDSTLTCTTPAGLAGTVKNVVVTSPNGASTDTVTFGYVLALPTVTSISPPFGPAAGSTTVTIKGTYFTGDTDLTGVWGVTIGGLDATNVKVVDDSTLTCTTPAGLAGTASVQVTAQAGTSAANSLFTYVTATPTDTYIYLKGGRGDGYVPLWTGELAEEGTTEKGEPYRNEFQSTVQLDNSSSASSGFTSGASAYWGTGSSSSNGSSTIGFGGQMTTPGHMTKVVITKEVVGNTAQAVNITPVFGSLSDTASGAAPRQYDKITTWLVFISSNGLGYKFRKTDVMGWGSQPRA